MKLLIAGILLCLTVETNAHWHHWHRFLHEAAQGALDIWQAYNDMKEANCVGAELYFRARGNYDAAKRGPGGKWAAEVISNPAGEEDSAADQEANLWGREGNDPNFYRPEGLPEQY